MNCWLSKGIEQPVLEHKKRKLKFEEQIAHMRDQKGIGFSIINEEEAMDFLSYHNYYFRIKAYAKNYEQYSDEDNERICILRISLIRC